MQNDEFDLFDYLAQVVPNYTPMMLSQQQQIEHVYFRNARQRAYFTLQQGQVLRTLPYKYNIQIHSTGTGLQAGNEYFFELHVHRTATSREHVPFGMIVEKQMHVRGAPTNCIDFRVYFQVYSKDYGDAMFSVHVKNQNNQLVHETSSFVLAGRSRNI